jgi:hypothetical protein
MRTFIVDHHEPYSNIPDASEVIPGRSLDSCRKQAGDIRKNHVIKLLESSDNPPNLQGRGAGGRVQSSKI